MAKLEDKLKALVNVTAPEIHSDRQLQALREIEETLKAGADPDARVFSGKKTLLHHVLERIDNLFGIADILLASGAATDVVDDTGMTPLLTATSLKYEVPNLMATVICNAINVDGEIEGSDIFSNPLCIAALHERPETVRLLLSAGASPNVIDDRGKCTPLLIIMMNKYCKSHKKRLDIAQQLIDAGGDINAANAEGKTSLHLACHSGHVETIKWLLSHGASLTTIDKYGESVSKSATQSGNVEVVRLLIEAADARAGVVVNHVVPEAPLMTSPMTALNIAIARKDVDMLRCLLELDTDPNSSNEVGESALVSVLKDCSLGVHSTCMMLDLLLSHGADMYNSGIGHSMSPFEMLVTAGRVAETRLFLKHGLDLGRYNPQNGNDFSPLHSAVWSGGPTAGEMLSLLLEYNSQRLLNLEHKQNGLTPLCLAVLGQESPNCVKLLLEAGADVNKVDRQGRTPLEFTLNWNTSNRKLEFIQCFVEAGANLRYCLHTLVKDRSNWDCDFLRWEFPNHNNKKFLPVQHKSKERMEQAKCIVKYRALYESQYPITDPVECKKIGSDKVRSYYEACVAEIGLLRDSLFYDSITYYDVLTAREGFQKLRDVELFEVVNKKVVRGLFPIFANDICKTLEEYRRQPRST